MTACRPVVPLPVPLGRARRHRVPAPPRQQNPKLKPGPGMSPWVRCSGVSRRT
ncbi:hypothetical protein ACFFX0_09985 [Citricoccus parietis]|uniref:Uncharacterized protein n=1 Tax=Citricoccus parietis TaxID=592307 RepID=A0ABV5FXW5_9MICC